MGTTNESQIKGKDVMITAKIDYKNIVKEVKTMIKYVYPDREEDERQNYRRENTHILHSNISTYAQVLMLFHNENSVPTNLSNKCLKMHSESKHQRRNETHQKR